LNRRGALSAIAALAAPGLSRAAAPLRIVVAYPPGGVSDEIARAVAAVLAEQTGMVVLVEHRPGAGGRIAMEWLARSSPDGLALCFCAITPLTLMPRYAAPGHDPLPDVTPVIGVMSTPTLLAGTPALAAGSFSELLALARTGHVHIRWATTGVGTTGYRVLEAVSQASGMTFTHIPYKGGGQTLHDAVGGQFEVLSTNVAGTQLGHVRAGRLKPLAVGARARLDTLPGVATLAELGFASANLQSHFGLFAPGGTSPARVRHLNGQVDRALRHPSVQQRLLSGNNLPLAGSAEAFASLICNEARANEVAASGCNTPSPR
jgi:tripartite-type tricarboxylate transporter receptor subunit TctC